MSCEYSADSGADRNYKDFFVTLLPNTPVHDIAEV